MLPEIDWHKSIVDWVIDHPEAVPLFQEYAIDYCCAGKSLHYACLQADANLQEIGAKLHALQEQTRMPLPE